MRERKDKREERYSCFLGSSGISAAVKSKDNRKVTTVIVQWFLLLRVPVVTPSHRWASILLAVLGLDWAFRVGHGTLLPGVSVTNSWTRASRKVKCIPHFPQNLFCCLRAHTLLLFRASNNFHQSPTPHSKEFLLNS